MELTFEDVLEMLGSSHQKFVKGGYTDLIYFDQYKKKISNGKVVLYENGKIVPQKIKLKYGMEVEITEDMRLLRETVSNPYDKLEELYRDYKYSVPNEADIYSRCNFKAVDINDLTPQQFREGKRRQLTRIKLELFVMFNKFPWENEKHHYWQSENEPSLIIYKEWRN